MAYWRLSAGQGPEQPDLKLKFSLTLKLAVKLDQMIFRGFLWNIYYFIILTWAMHDKGSLERFSFYQSGSPHGPTDGCISTAVETVNCDVEKKTRIRMEREKRSNQRKPPRCLRCRTHQKWECVTRRSWHLSSTSALWQECRHTANSLWITFLMDTIWE